MRASANRIVKPLVLIGALVLGGVSVLLWSKMRGGIASQNHPDPPLLTLAAAQAEVKFPIRAPKQVPANGIVQGARVFEVRVQNLDEIVAQFKAQQKPFTGYGLLFLKKGEHFSVRAAQASPAEKAGMSSREPGELLALNGRPVPADNVSAWKMITSIARGSGALSVTYSTLREGVRTVRIQQKAEYLTGAEMPDLAQGKRIAIPLSIRGKQVTLLEWPAKRMKASVPGSRMVNIQGFSVMLTGPELTPSAFWSDGGMDFTLDNSRGALTRDEVVSLIESMKKLTDR